MQGNGAARARRATAALLLLGGGLAGAVSTPAAADPAPGLPAPPPEVRSGRVIRVTDGDTVVIAAGAGELKARLAQIDAPERAQPYGGRAREALSRLVLQRAVELVAVGVDRYGRTIAELTVEIDGQRVHVNREMVRWGHAWAYTTYVTNLEIIDLEQEARRAKRGLWALPAAERDPPWQWRHDRRRGNQPQGVDSAPLLPGCEVRKTCSKMSTCAEARFQLDRCGNTSLDRDGDGTPCETLCPARR